MKKLILFSKPYSKFLLVIWIVLILGISSIPNLPSPKISTSKVVLRLDYIFHFCEYGFLTFLTFLSFAGKDLRLNLKKYVIITICLVIFAIADEFHQKLIPGRTFNLKDILSNLSGIFAGLIFCLIIFRIIQIKEN
jgi:VanZ family protein